MTGIVGAMLLAVRMKHWQLVSPLLNLSPIGCNSHRRCRAMNSIPPQSERVVQAWRQEFKSIPKRWPPRSVLVTPFESRQQPCGVTSTKSFAWPAVGAKVPIRVVGDKVGDRVAVGMLGAVDPNCIKHWQFVSPFVNWSLAGCNSHRCWLAIYSIPAQICLAVHARAHAVTDIPKKCPPGSVLVPPDESRQQPCGVSST